MSVHIYKKYNVFISPEKIKGYGKKNRLSLEEQKMISDEETFMDELFNSIDFTFDSVNPTGIYNDTWRFMETIGSISKEKYINSDGKEDWKVIKYIPNDAKEVTLIIVDHLYYLKSERGYETKQNIDKFSEYCVKLRNLFGVSILAVQQFNSGLNAIDRQKFKQADLSPQQTDFKDTTNPYQDADVVLGIMDPFKLELYDCLGYNIRKLRSNFLMLKIIKNRLSSSNISLGLLVHAKAGSFIELPPSHEMNEDRYNKALKLLE